MRSLGLPLQRRLRFVRCLRRPFAVGVAPAKPMFAPRGGLTPAHTAALTFAAAAITAAAIFAAALAAAAAASALLESLLEVDPRLRPAAADAILHPY